MPRLYYYYLLGDIRVIFQARVSSLLLTAIGRIDSDVNGQTVDGA